MLASTKALLERLAIEEASRVAAEPPAFFQEANAFDDAPLGGRASARDDAPSGRAPADSPGQATSTGGDDDDDDGDDQRAGESTEAYVARLRTALAATRRRGDEGGDGGDDDDGGAFGGEHATARRRDDAQQPFGPPAPAVESRQASSSMNGHPSDDAFGGVGEHATPRREDPRRPSDASADYSRASSSSTRDCPSDDDDAEDAFGGAGGDDLDSPAAWFDAQDSVREFDDLAHGIKVGLRGKSEGLPLLRATQMLLEGRYDSGFEAAADNSDGATRDVARIRARIASLTPSETYPHLVTDRLLFDRACGGCAWRLAAITGRRILLCVSRARVPLPADLEILRSRVRADATAAPSDAVMFELALENGDHKMARLFAQQIEQLAAPSAETIDGFVDV